jgi:hypothetical protein
VLARDGFDTASLAGLALRRLDWPLPFGLLATIGLIGAPLAAIVRLAAPGRTSRGESGAAGTLLVATVAWILLALYLVQPFSGTINQPNAGIQHMLRYLLPVFLLGLALAPAVLPRGRNGVAVGATLAACALALGVGVGHEAGDLIGIAVGALASLAAIRGWSALPRPNRARLALPLGALALALIVATAIARTSEKTRDADAALFDYVGFQGRFDGGWRALDALPAGSRVALASQLPSSHAFYYPQFGRRLQLVPVPIDHRGNARPALYESFAAEPRAWWWEFERRPSTPRSYVENLRRAGVDFVLVNRQGFAQNVAPPQGWPPARARLAASSHAERIHHDPWSEIYALRE